MHCRNRLPYLLTLLTLTVSFALPFVEVAGLEAQDATPSPANSPATSPATSPPAPADAAAQATPDTTAPSPPDAQSRQLAPQTPEQRARVLRDAQARVRARKQQRIAALIADTYNHRFEAYFGGGYLRFPPGKTLQRATEADWNAGISDSIGPRLAITADFRGYYGTVYLDNNIYAIHSPSISQYTFMAGPQFRLTERPRWATSVQVLAGAGHGNFDTGTGGLPGRFLGLYPNATVFNVSAGVPVDYNLGPGLALRLTPGILLTDYGGSLQHNFGFNAGVVYRFGHRK